jgi:iron complex transport system substrate-binding protein
MGAALLAAATPPKRIISTAPSITETLFALGLGDRVVGVTQYCKFPPEAEKIPRIGSWSTTNLEAVLAARPDLIVIQRTAVHDSNRFQALGLRTLEVRMDHMTDIHASIDAIGAAAGVPERAKALNASIRKQLEAVRARVASRPPKSVLFIVGRTPGTLEGIIAAAGSSYLSEAIEIAGGRNIFADSRLGWVKVVQEEIVGRNPEVIVDMGEHAEASPISEAQRRSEIALWRKFGTVSAVRNNRINIVSSAIYVVPGPRVVDLVQQLARMFHPEPHR